MTDDERRAFLMHGTRTGKVATARPNGHPHLAPVWFVLDGDDVVFTTHEETVKGRSLRRDTRVALCVDDQEPPYSFVLIEGEALISDDLDEGPLVLEGRAGHDAAEGACRAVANWRAPQAAGSGLGQADPDEEVLARVARGDPAAVRALVARKLPRLLSLGQRMLGDRAEAEDVAQEAFLRVWRQAPKWRPGEARFDTWLHRVALNLCYDRLRRRRETPGGDPPEQADPGPAPDRGLMAADVGSRVRAALQALPERQREAVVLCHYQELGNIEAAAVMGVSVEALESLLGRGRRALRAALADMVEG